MIAVLEIAQCLFITFKPASNWVIENGLLQENFVVIDVDCQGGEIPRWGSLGDRLEFYGFDPIGEVIEELRREERPGRTYFEMALGDEDGEREFFVTNNSFGSSFFASFASPSTELLGDPEIRRGARMVAVRRLDSLFASGALPRADCIFANACSSNSMSTKRWTCCSCALRTRVL